VYALNASSGNLSHVIIIIISIMSVSPSQKQGA
jgi:hypothetical protein